MDNNNLPQKVQDKIDILAEYELVHNVKEFNIIHIYPQENCYPDGYYCAKFIDIHLFNSETMQKQILKSRHDALTFIKRGPEKVLAYVDGSVYMEVPTGFVWFLKVDTPNLYIYNRMR